MPLHQKQPFQRIPPPADLKPDEELYYCKITNEVFREYNKFFDRVILCNSLVWTCSLTGKSGLTFQEALESEKNARVMLKKFPEALKRPLLFLASLTVRGRINDMCDDVYNFVKERFFIHEDVEVTLNGIKKSCEITKVISPEKESRASMKGDSKNKTNLKGISPDKYKYEVVVKDAKASPPKHSVATTVRHNCLSRGKGSYTKANNKMFLKYNTRPVNGVWKVKDSSKDLFELGKFSFASVHPGPLPKYASSPTKKKAAANAAVVSSPNDRKKKSTTNSATDSPAPGKKSVQSRLNFKKETEEERRLTLEREQEEFEKQREVLEKQRQEKRDEMKRRMEEDREKVRLQKLQEREKKKEEKRQIAEYLNSWKKPRDDLECDDLKDLPKPSPVDCAIPLESFGDALMVLEFLDKFSTIIKLKDSFPHGFSFEHLEKALTETDIQGYFSDLIQLLLTSLFQLKDFDVVKTDKKSIKIPDLTSDLTTEESEKIADAALMWLQIYHGTQLDNMPLDSFSITEVLRLHILASGSTKDNSYNLGVNGDSEDPGLAFKSEEQDLLKRLSTFSIFELNCEERLKILNLLVQQLVSCETIRNQLEENFAKARPLYNELKQIKWAIARLKKENSANNGKKKADTDSKTPEEAPVQNENNEPEEDPSPEVQQASDEKLQREVAKKKSEYLRKEKEIRAQIKRLQSSYQVLPIGQDRAFRRFWVFNSLSGIFVEDDDKNIGPCLLKETPQVPANTTSNTRLDNSAGSIREYLQHLGDAKNGSSDKENDILQDLAIIQSEFSVPLNGRKLSDLNTRVDHKKSVAEANARESFSCVQCAEKKTEFQDSMPLYCPHSKTSSVFGLCTASIDTCPVHNLYAPRVKWSFYYKTEDLEALLGCLNSRGFREGPLRKALLNEKEALMDMLSKFQYRLLNKSLPPSSHVEVRKSQRNSMNPRKSAFTDMKPEIAMEVTLRDMVLELEQRIFSGGLGALKVSCRDTWRDNIEQAIALLVPEDSKDPEEVKPIAERKAKCPVAELAQCLHQIAEGIETKFLTPPLNEDASKAKEKFQKSREQDIDNKGGTTNGHISRLERWQESVAQCTSFSQLFVHLGTLERSVAWSRSILKAHCRLCRRKGDGENMLLCDGCNRGHHLYCLKPPLEQIPDGDWFCVNCKPPEKVVSPRKTERPNYVEIEDDSNESEEDDIDMQSAAESEASEEEDGGEEEEETEIVDEVCETCSVGGTVICCDKCPKLYHPECIGLKRIPRGEWLCPACTKKDQVLKKTQKHSPTGNYGTRAQTILEKAKVVSRRELRNNGIQISAPRQSKRKRSPSPVVEKQPVKKLRPDTKKGESENPFKKVYKDSDMNMLRRRSKSISTSNMFDYKTCLDLLVELMHHPSSWPFLVPVNKRDAPGYHEVIKHPMDFGTIKSNLNNTVYKKNEEVVRDIHLVFQNCELYNSKHTAEYKAGRILRKELPRLLSQYNLC